MQEQIEAVQEETVEEVVQENVKTYLNKQNRNTLAAFNRSRSKVFQPYGRTYNAGRNKAKREKRLSK
jgi:hypothetical protein